MSDEQLEDVGDVPVVTTLKQAKVVVEEYALDCIISSSRDLQIYVPITQVCSIFDIDSDAQIRRIRRIPSLRNGLVKVNIKTDNDTLVQYREVYAISMMRFHSWLSSIDVSRIKSDSENLSSLIAFQEKAADVLYGYFARPLLPKDLLDESEDFLPLTRLELFKNLETARRAEEMAQEANEEIIAIKNRISNLEIELHHHDGQSVLNQKQVSRIKQCAALIAYQLEKKNAGGFPTVYAQIYKEAGVSKVWLIEKKDFARVRSFCLNWYLRLVPPGTKTPQVFTDPVEDDLGF